jgi:putative DNA primase/helicase
LDTYAKTDLGNADRFVDQFGELVRYLPQRKAWLLWNDSYWAVDITNRVKDFATQTARNIYNEVAAINDNTERTELVKWAKVSQAAPRINSLIELAKCNQTIATDLDELDSDPWLFNCANGTINLKTGDFYEAKPSDLITKSSPVIYDPNASCPIWHKFLNRAFGQDGALIEFMQRATGYSFTGIINDEALFFLYGSGANGKSTFLETIMYMLSDYTIKLGLESLLKKGNGGGIPNDIARLKGARLCVSSEIDQDGRFNESKLKDLASRDTITARFLHGEFFDFRQSHKLWVFGNHRPVIHGNDDGIWRRIKLVPFNVTIPDDEKDHELDVKLRGELSGIFNWVLSGCKQWQQVGLAVPDSVNAATAHYRDEMDIISNFINETCNLNQSAVVKANCLQISYKNWCNDNGHKPLSSSSLRQQLGSKGIKHHRKSAGSEYQGLELKPLPVVNAATLTVTGF